MLRPWAESQLPVRAKLMTSEISADVLRTFAKISDPSNASAFSADAARKAFASVEI